jgi:hypothetical protein
MLNPFASNVERAEHRNAAVADSEDRMRVAAQPNIQSLSPAEQNKMKGRQLTA